MTQIILNQYLHKNLSFYDAAQTVIDKPNNRKDAIVGAKIIQNVDFELIPWFLTTRFQSEYHDLFYQTWKEDYKLLIDIINKVYLKTFNDRYTEEDELIDKKHIVNIDGMLKKTQAKRSTM